MYQELINKKWQQILELESMLKRFDYQDHRRHDEPDKAMAEEVQIARNNARARINELEDEIADLELLQQEYLMTIDELKFE